MLTQLLVVVPNFKRHSTFFYFGFAAIVNCSSLFIKSIPRTHLPINDTIMISPLWSIRPRWSIKREHHSEARCCGAAEKRNRIKGQSERMWTRVSNAGAGGAQSSRVLSTRFGLRGREGKRGPPCSRPRNNVSGLWFFIRARSHNGLSRSDPST